MNKFRFIATTLFGLENVLASELSDLGAEDIKILNRAVGFSGSLVLMYKANLCLRTALRILMHLKSFRVKDEDQLYNELLKIEWESLFDEHHSIAVTPVINSPVFRHSRYIAQKSKDAIVDRFRKTTGIRPSVNLNNPDIAINIHIDSYQVNVSLDSSGSPLFKRGYRIDTHPASMNEVLAAGMIKLSGWENETDSCLIDPMCGAGTIALEAAMISLKIYPYIFRTSYSFFNWKYFDQGLFTLVKEKIPKPISSNRRIYASDNTDTAINKSLNNIRNAGLQDIISLTKIDFFKSTPPEKKGTLIMNPPYGERLSNDDPNQFFRMIGKTLKYKYTGYNTWIISSNNQAMKYIGLRPEKKVFLFNGDLKCCFNKYSIYEGSRKIS